MARQRQRLGPIKLVLPATSANLGPAFDCAAIALKLFLTIKAHAAEKFSIIASGRDQGICGALTHNLIIDTYTGILRQERRPVQPLALEIDNEIPIGKGCGSSAAARLAGISLAVHFGNMDWGGSRIITEAAHREQHADNAAACWSGGLCLTKMPRKENADCEVATITPKAKWPLLLAIPEMQLSTEKARHLLPSSYARPQVISNLQNSMFLVAGFAQGRPQMLRSALGDELHQPYRASLCPLLPSLQNLSNSRSILGAVLSGAGPSVLLFLEPNANVARTVTLVKHHLRKNGLSAELVQTNISSFGASRSFMRSGLRV